MNPLEKKILSRINSKGPITFEEFMEMALYDPDYGYYHSGKVRIGREGDFYTSSHVHPAFGSTIGKQIEEIWELMGRPAEFTVVEMAPGAGFLSRDLLDFIKNRQFYRALRYYLVERAPAQRDRQKDLLAPFSDIVKWIPSIDELRGLRGCILSNELLDAIPVHILSMEDELREVYVDAEDSQLIRRTGALSTDRIQSYLKEFSIVLERGYETEVNLQIQEWLHDIAAALEEGFVLTIDYGYNARDYYSEDRNRGTLLCYYGHQFNENPLEHVGEQDITAHVNFSSVAKWGEAAGLKAIGFCSQGSFLVSLGIEEELKSLQYSKDYLFEAARIKKLIMPQGMGESHMVMAQYKGSGNPALKGFSISNRLRYL